MLVSQVRKLCLDIQGLNMYKQDLPTGTLERYCHLQQVQRDKAWKELSKISAQMTSLVSDACKASMKAHTEVRVLDAQLYTQHLTKQQPHTAY